MEYYKLIVELIGHIAWPTVAVFIFLWLVKEINAGLLQKIFKDGGSLKFGGMEISIQKGLDKAKSEAQEAGVQIVQTEEAIAEAVEDASAASPYEKVMDAWAELADEITSLAVRFGGTQDRRLVRDNIELLVDRNVIAENVGNAIRTTQQVRNGIRRIGEVSEQEANSFVTTAHSLSAELRRSLPELKKRTAQQ